MKDLNQLIEEYEEMMAETVNASNSFTLNTTGCWVCYFTQQRTKIEGLTLPQVVEDTISYVKSEREERKVKNNKSKPYTLPV